MNRNFQNHLNNLAFLLIVVGYFHIFQIGFIPNTMRVFYQMGMLAMLIALILIRVVYHPGPHIKMHFGGLIAIMIISTIPSFFVAAAYHNQPFLVTLFADRQILFYLIYFYLHLFKVDYRFVQRLIILIGVFAILLYFMQLTVYPVKILDIGVIEGRGTIRLFVAGMICTQAAYFYFLNQFFARNKLLYLFLALLSMSVFILQGTRQLIFGMAFLTLVNLLFTRRIQSKFLITVVLSIAITALFFVFQEIFTQIAKVSTHQASNIKGGIRLQEARFYTVDFMQNAWAYIFGNSDSALYSQYDLKMIYYSVKYHYFISDIGVVGDYVKYGIVFTITGLIMLGKSLLFKIDKSFVYLKYYIMSQCFTLVTGGGILSGVDIIILMSLYVFDVQNAMNLQKMSAEESEPSIETNMKAYVIDRTSN